jgi:hypothetical protein
MPNSVLPDDSTLTSQGLKPEGRGKVLLIACGALAREIIALRDANGWDHLDLTCLPAILHNTPEKITDAVRASVTKWREKYDDIFVVYADCGTGGLLKKACEDMGVEMLEGPHCYSFFEGNARFEEIGEVTAFYLTDFLTRQFDSFVWKPLGLDRHPQLREMYFGHYEKLVYQSQTDDPALLKLARSHAERMGLAFEHRPTGYGDLKSELARI